MLSEDARAQVTKLTADVARELGALNDSAPEDASFQNSVALIGAALQELEVLCGIQFFPVETEPQALARAAPTAAPALPPEERFGRVEDFFTEVANGVVKAQQDLDRRSEEYLRTRSPVSAPAVFRIPKVNAEFTLGAEMVTNRQIRFIVSTKTETREAMQQKLGFEIVSVPAPIDELAAPRDQTAGPETRPAASGQEGGTFEALPVSTDEHVGQAESAAASSTSDQSEASPAEEGESGRLSHAQIVAALSRTLDIEGTDYKEEAIAKEMIVNHSALVSIDHPACEVVLYSPEPEAGQGRDLSIAIIDRESEEVSAMYTTQKKYTKDIRRFQTVAQQLAELVGSYKGGRTE